MPLSLQGDVEQEGVSRLLSEALKYPWGISCAQTQGAQ